MMIGPHKHQERFELISISDNGTVEIDVTEILNLTCFVKPEKLFASAVEKIVLCNKTAFEPTELII